MMRASGTTLSPFAHRLFLVMWLASMAANIGNAVQSVGASWLMTAIDGRADKIALIQTAISLPIMLLALVGGAVADIFDRRRVMLCAQAGIAIISALLAVLAFLSWVTPWMLIGLTFALGAGVAFYNPAAQASIGAIVDRKELAGAVSLNVLGFNIARTLGPALGGGIVAVGGPFVAFLCNAGTSAIAFVILLFWRPGFGARSGQGLRHIPVAMIEGLRQVSRSAALRAIVGRALAFTLMGSAVWALMPLVALRFVGGGAQQFGILLSALGLGAVAGASISHAVRRRFSNEALVTAAGGIFGMACLVVAARPGLVITFLALFVGGAGWVQALSGFSVMSQMWSAREVVGRVTATVSTVVFGGLAIGSWLWGHIAENFGLVLAIIGSGAGMVLLALVGRLLPLPENPAATDHG